MLTISAYIDNGDQGRKYAQVDIGGVTVTVYESLVRQGGVVIDIDVAHLATPLAVTIDDEYIAQRHQ